MRLPCLHCTTDPSSPAFTAKRQRTKMTGAMKYDIPPCEIEGDGLDNTRAAHRSPEGGTPRTAILRDTDGGGEGVRRKLTNMKRTIMTMLYGGLPPSVERVLKTVEEMTTAKRKHV